MNTHQMSPGAAGSAGGGNIRTPTRKKREMTYHYAGKVHVRGLLRRVWRPRYLALGDDGYLRYHESIPPLFQQEGGYALAAGSMHHHSYSNNAYSLHNTHRPKSIFAILDGARTIDPNSVVDQHVALPQGVYGFVFRGRAVELYTTSTANNDTAGLGGGGGNINHNDREQAQGGGGALIVPSSPGNIDSQIKQHSSAKEAVFNQIFPKGTNRRKAAQKIAKKAINPDVLCGFRPGSNINCDGGPIRDNGGNNMSRGSSSSSLVGYEQPLLDEDVTGGGITSEGRSSNHEWGRDSHDSNNTMGSFQEVERSQVCTDLVGDNTMRNHNNTSSSHQRSQRKQNNVPSTTKSTIQVQVQASSIQSREYLCAVSTAEEAESWVVALRWAAEHRRRIRYGNNNSVPAGGRNESIHSSNAIAPNNVALSSAIPIVSSRNVDSGEQTNRKISNANQTHSNITSSQLDQMRDEEFPRVISPSEMNDTSHSKGSSKLSSEISEENMNSTHTEVGSDSKASLTSLLIEQEGWCKTEPENKSKKPTVIEESQTTTTPGISLVMTTPDDHPLSELNLHTNNHNQEILARDDSMLPESSSSPKKHSNSPGGATMVVTKVSRLQLPQIFVGLENNTQMNKSDINWLPFKLPLPGDELILQYEIQLLLLRNCKPRTEISVHPESIEERTIHKSLHDVIGIVRDLMAKYKECGENDPPTPQRKGVALPDLPQNETICLLDDVEATLLSCMESNKNSTNQTHTTISTMAHGTITDISSSVSNATSSVEIIDQVMRKLSKDRGICSSRQFQQFLGLHATHAESSLAVGSKSKTTKFAVSKTADAEQIVKNWLAQTDHPSTTSKLQLGLAITLRHSVGGPILSLVAVWSTARLASIMWCLVSGTGIIISIPFERYATLFVLSFFFGHYCGASSQANKRPAEKLEKRPSTGVRPMPSPISISESKGGAFADELAVDDDHSTVVEEGASESDEETFIAETSTISSPIPLYPANQGITCWSKPDHKIFMVRGPSYLEDRIKMPSAPAIFECRGVDVWITDNAERNIARHPSVLGGRIDEEHTFVVNFLLPFSNFVAYFSIPPIEEMPANIADVWTRFIKGDQQYRDRKLKLLPVVVDGPWIVKKAVGPGTSPAVIGRDLPLQYYFSEPTATRKGIYEVDVLVTASRIARGILNVVKGHTKSLSIAFAFIIEASEEAQLPETVLCAFQVHSLHLEDCPSLPDCYPDG